MKNKKYNSEQFLALGIVFVFVAIGGYISGNFSIGTAFFPIGLVFAIYGIINKPK